MIHVAALPLLDKAHKKHNEQVLRTMKKALTQFCLAALPLSAAAALTSPSDSNLTKPDSLNGFKPVAMITPDKVTLSPTALKMSFAVEAKVATVTLTMFGYTVRMRTSCEDTISLSNQLNDPATQQEVRDNIVETAGTLFTKISESAPLPLARMGEMDEHDANVRFATEVLTQTANLHESAIKESATVCRKFQPL